MKESHLGKKERSFNRQKNRKEKNLERKIHFSQADVLSGIFLHEEIRQGNSYMTLIKNAYLHIENYLSILTYTPSEIKIRVKRGTITICGTGLVIPFYDRFEMNVAGNMDQISFCFEEEGK